MQNEIRKSWNNALASPVREIKGNLDKTAHFIAKETHCPHNSVTELDMAKLTSCLFQCFITRLLLITALRYLVRNLLISNNLDEIWFWKKTPFRLLFHRGVHLITSRRWGGPFLRSFFKILALTWCYGPTPHQMYFLNKESHGCLRLSNHRLKTCVLYVYAFLNLRHKV